MTKPAVLIIAVCEFLVGFVFGLFCILFLLVLRTDANDGRKTAAGAVNCAAGSLLCFLIGYAMLHRHRWGWYASWVVVVLMVAFGCFLVSAAFLPDPTGDGGEVIFLAVPILVFALPACWIMLTSKREDFVSGEGI